jgi:hypothetical protein
LPRKSAPPSALYDNLEIAIAGVYGDGRCERARAFTEPASHSLFRSGRSGTGNDEAKAEGRQAGRHELHDDDPAGVEFRRSRRHAGRQVPESQSQRAGPVARRSAGCTAGKKIGLIRV